MMNGFVRRGRPADLDCGEERRVARSIGRPPRCLRETEFTRLSAGRLDSTQEALLRGRPDRPRNLGGPSRSSQDLPKLSG
jgi:hypothetical protein